MKLSDRISLFAPMLAASILCCHVGSSAPSAPAPAADAAVSIAAAQQFYTRIMGHWVGTTSSRLDRDEPVTGYFHLLVTRVDEKAFREEYTFYRVHPKTGVLERSGTQSDLSSIESNGAIRRSVRGSGTVLIDFKPKKQAFEASGTVQFTRPEHADAEVKGKVAVDGMPLGLGKNGKVRKATTTWTLEADTLIGQTQVQMSFRRFFLTKRYRIETRLRARRGSNVWSIAQRQ